LVLEKLEKVKSLEEEIKAAEANPEPDASSFAGTVLGNTLYLDLVQYQNEKKALEKQMDELEKLRTGERSKLDAIPEKAAALAQLELKKQSLETAHSLLYSRLREAQLFEDNAPGYYSIFAPASPDSVTSSSKLVKTALFTIGGGIFFTIVTTLAALASELLDPRLRTPWEAAKAFDAKLLASFPKGELDHALGAELWARWIGAAQQPGLPRVIWSPAPGEEEERFWHVLFERASMLLNQLHVIDCGRSPLKLSTNRKITIEHLDIETFSIVEAQQLGNRLRESARRGGEIWIRLCGPVHEPLTTLAKFGQPPLVLVRLHAEENEFWKTQGDLLSKTVGHAAGIVTLGETPFQKLG
jgi:hypothetical protein